MDKSQFCWNGPAERIAPNVPIAAPAAAGIWRAVDLAGALRRSGYSTQLPARRKKRSVKVGTEATLYTAGRDG